jgi:hypothetical protein
MFLINGGKMKSKILLAIFALSLVFGPQLVAQNGTPHGVFLTWNASAGTVQGYYVFRCPGTCTTSSTGWKNITTGLVNDTSYVDPAAGLTLSSTYSYAVLAVDLSGNQSSFSNISPAVIPASFPTNPAPPTGCNTKVQ